MPRIKKIKESIATSREKAMNSADIDTLKQIISEQDDALMELASYIYEQETYNNDIADALIELAGIMEE